MLNIVMFAVFFAVGGFLASLSKLPMRALFVGWGAVYCGAALAGLFSGGMLFSPRIELIDAIGALALVCMTASLWRSMKAEKRDMRPPMGSWRGAFFFVVAVIFIASMFYANRFDIVPLPDSVVIH